MGIYLLQTCATACEAWQLVVLWRRTAVCYTRLRSCLLCPAQAAPNMQTDLAVNDLKSHSHSNCRKGIFRRHQEPNDMFPNMVPRGPSIERRERCVSRVPALKLPYPLALPILIEIAGRILESGRCRRYGQTLQADLQRYSSDPDPL
jgi:hypothetical protein